MSTEFTPAELETGRTRPVLGATSRTDIVPPHPDPRVTRAHEELIGAFDALSAAAGEAEALQRCGLLLATRSRHERERQAA